ncbi:Protein of unknown function [Aequorivita viscosa]|uniref:DUF2490 domain-containing protein n=2 Tax=Aequorivita viscosa TaxID=797419 RepID=A0A1M6NVJ8_9FLAO|nr:Protein of unknown function [Aequorivita viscosa]SHJ99779.1 Protein of unknown function [Aequorivita viscosa]
MVNMMRIIIIIFFYFISVTGISQEKFTGSYEPFIEVGYAVSKLYSQEFSVEGRFHWYDAEVYKFQAKQVDLAHFSSFKLNTNNELALGLKYRFEENFGGDDKNEIRLVEEYKYEIDTERNKLEHRIRAEQRFSGSLTSHRFRYKFEASQLLGTEKRNTDNIYLIGNLETLVTISKIYKPSYEQRFTTGIGVPFTAFTEFEFGLQYRIDDFTQEVTHELFFISGLKLDL